MARRAIWILLLIGLGWLSAHAQAGVVRPQACVRAAKPGDSVAAQFAVSTRFDCKTDQADLGPGDFWVRMQGFSIVPQKGDQLVINLMSMWEQGATVYFRYADGYIASYHYSADQANRDLTIGAVFEIPIPWRAAALTGIASRIEESGNVNGILLGQEITTATASAKGRMPWLAVYAAFAGIALTLLVYNLALWGALRHNFQLYYCGMVGALGGHVLSASGAMIFAFPSLNNIVRMQLSYFFFALSTAFALLFIRDFFEPRVISGSLRWVATTAAYLLIGTSTLFFACNPINVPMIVRLYYFGFLPGILALLAMLAAAGWRKSNYLGIFMLAWSPPIAAAILRWLYGLDVLPYNAWIEKSSIIAFGAEALISAAAISIRVRSLSKERDLARAEETLALELARIDALTGLRNRRGFLDAALGSKGERQLLLLDIDHFKKVNDTFGHDRGDQVLKDFGLMLRKWCPEGALVARIGGEEFAVLMPESGAEPGAISRLVSMIRQTDFDREIKATASIGIARGMLADEDGWQVLYREADAALYRAKREGRDQVCHAAIDDLAHVA